MSNQERSFAAAVAEQNIQTQALSRLALRNGSSPEHRLSNSEFRVDAEPVAEVFGKMSELSFQKHGGSDNSTMHQRGG